MAGPDPSPDLTAPPITVGSSDVASILGISPWSSPSKTWARLTGLVPRYDSNGTAATRRGRILESALLDEWCRIRKPLGRTPGPTIDDEPVIRDGWKSCRVDMLAVMEVGPDIIVEAKTTRSWDGWGPDGSSDVPVYYAAQVLWQMHVLDISQAELVAYSPLDDDLRIYPLTRRLDVEAKVVARVERWMREHVFADPPTPPGDLPLDVVEAIHRGGGGGKDWLDANESDLDLAKQLAAAREALRAAEVEEGRLRALLCQRIGDAYGIKGVATWGQVKGRETVSASDIKTFKPELYDELIAQNIIRRGASSRQFRFNFKDAQ